MHSASSMRGLVILWWRARPAGTSDSTRQLGWRWTRSEFRPADVADHERMAGQGEPRLRGARLVRNQEADEFGCVRGNVQRLGDHVSEFENVAVAHAMKLGRSLGIGKEHIFCACGFGEAVSRRGVVGVNMRVDDIENFATVSCAA